MAYKTLGLILAAGKGTRVKDLLTPDAQVKAMLKVGDDEQTDGKRLIEHSFQFLEGAVDEIAVLTFPTLEFSGLDAVVEERGAKVIKQKAKNKGWFDLVDLPEVLINQYFFDKENDYLRGFDSILTMPCDLVFYGVDLAEMVDLHNQRLLSPGSRQMTMLSSLGGFERRAENFKVKNDRIVSWRKYKGKELKGYKVCSQAGVYIFSKGLLSHPYMIARWFGGNFVYRHLTSGRWENFGIASTHEKK